MDQLEAVFFAQGRVDAILLRMGGAAVFIDSGFRSNGLTCVEKMREMGVRKLDAYIGTHGHMNHIGGAGAIIRAMDPDAVYIPHDRVREAIIKHAAQGAERQAAQDARYEVLRPGDEIELGGARFVCLGPLKIVKCSPGAYAENANSLILRMEYGERTMLLTGDTSAGILNAIAEKTPGVLGVEVLKNPHHNGALTLATLKKVKPEITVLLSNVRPGKAYRARLESVGSRWYSASRTGHGRVTLTATAARWTAKTSK